ncbi:MAG: hypothetical protein N3D11_15920 [Candidatus Sumerlaeia bacterium]|nr:hypothetical protein [Candidatus Sumerlaeia bacterium]
MQFSKTYNAIVLSVWALSAGAPASLETSASRAALFYKLDAGPYDVAVVYYDWKDATRGRDVPVKIYHPQATTGSLPIIVFSHGLGGSRDGYEYLGRHWASHGYVSVHVQHIGSDSAVWKNQGLNAMNAMREAAATPQNAIARPLDIRFVLDQMERMNHTDGPFKGRLDLDRIGVAGHSFGAYTTLAAAGQVFVLPGGRETSLADPRVKAAIPMSAPVPRDRTKLDRAFGKISIPCLHMTGTLDDSPIGDTTAADRRLPFDHSKAPDQYLVIFKDGDHMIFSGRAVKTGRAAKKDARFQNLIRMSTTAFWDAYLKGDRAAKQWLADGGFEAALGTDGTFEKRRAQ